MAPSTDFTADFVREIKPLLYEYQEALKTIHDKVRDLLGKIRELKRVKAKVDRLKPTMSDFELLWRYFKAILTPSRELVEHISRTITQGNLCWIDRIEMQLCLAKFEYILNSTEISFDIENNFIKENS